MLNGLDLFSGIGGIARALRPFVRVVAYCECDQYGQAVLLSNMQRGNLDYAPIWDDVRTLRCEHIDAPIDIITAGFPCQDISVAGHGAGLEGSRSGLFFEIIRLCRDLRPRFVFLENVPAITVRGLDRVLMEFTSLGYDCRWTTVSAAELGAPHLRERWFLLAHANRANLRDKPECELGSNNSTKPRGNGAQKSMANAARLRRREVKSIPEQGRQEMVDVNGSSKVISDSDSERLEIRQSKPGHSRKELEATFRSDWWAIEPNVGRVANGIPSRVDRLRGLGNAVVPLQAREAFMRLGGL